MNSPALLQRNCDQQRDRNHSVSQSLCDGCHRLSYPVRTCRCLSGGYVLFSKVALHATKWWSPSPTNWLASLGLCCPAAGTIAISRCHSGRPDVHEKNREYGKYTFVNGTITFSLGESDISGVFDKDRLILTTVYRPTQKTSTDEYRHHDVSLDN